MIRHGVRQFQLDILELEEAQSELVPDCFSPTLDCRGDRRTLKDLVDMSRSSGSDGLAARETDRLLYCAHRDVRGDIAGATDRALSAELCPMDSVCYAGGVLATGEIVRSIGHWNPPVQWEIFEVQQGSVAMLLQERPGAQIHLVKGLPGDIYYVTPGSWHTTYVAHGHAVVRNIYPYSSSDATSAKYSSGHKPPAVTLRRGASGRINVVGAEARHGNVVMWTGDLAPTVHTEFRSMSLMPSYLMAKSASPLRAAAQAERVPFLRLLPLAGQDSSADV